MKPWLDEARVPLDGSWTWVRAVADAVVLVETGTIVEASLHHDLGEDGDGQRLPERRKLVH
jgi:hypothetical protein